MALTVKGGVVAVPNGGTHISYMEALGEKVDGLVAVPNGGTHISYFLFRGQITVRKTSQCPMVAHISPMVEEVKPDATAENVAVPNGGTHISYRCRWRRWAGRLRRSAQWWHTYLL